MALDILSTIIAAIFGFAHTATGLAALFLQKDLGLGFLLDTDKFDPPTVGGGEVIVGTNGGPPPCSVLSRIAKRSRTDGSTVRSITELAPRQKRSM